ncbi:MAG: hypothetical protein ACK44B_10025 [Flavobacteriales bacterium]
MTTREKVDQLENRLNVTELKVKTFGQQFQVYPWLKGRLFYKMITGNETLQKRDLKLYWKQITSIFYGILNVFRRYDIWAFSTSLERRPIEGKQFDKLFDYVGNESGYKTLVIETRIFHYHPYRSIASRYAISRSFFLLFEEIYGRLFLRNTRVNDEALLKAINSNVSEGIDHRTLLRKYLAQYRLMKFWLKILPNPKLVMLSVSYTNFGYIKAFKERGIKVAEVQHGIITKNHHAYNYAKGFTSDQFPDYLLTIGKKEKAVFDLANKFPVREVIPVGSYIIDHYATFKINSGYRKKPLVLFTLQDGQIGDKFIEFILGFKASDHEHFDILVQPRRNSKENYLKRYAELDSIEFSNQDFYSTVVKADLHCTVYSTTAIESLSLGIPNILVNIDDQSVEQLGPVLGGNQYTKVAQSHANFLEALDLLKNSDPERVKLSNEDNIMVNYKVNITQFLKEVI